MVIDVSIVVDTDRFILTVVWIPIFEIEPGVFTGSPTERRCVVDLPLLSAALE